MTSSRRTSGLSRRIARWTWPLLLLLVAWLSVPVRAGADYPGMSCLARVSGAFMAASYAVVLIPVATLLLLMARWMRRAWANGRRAVTVALGIVAAVLAVLYLLLGGVTVATGEHAIACPALGGTLRALHCWRSGSAVEVNATGQRPNDLQALQAMGQALAESKQDVVLYEAFVFDTIDPAVIDYSNARLFLLQQPDQTAFGDLCLNERKARAADIAAHRVAFYRYSLQQRPPVDAFFLQDRVSGENGYEIIDYRHGGEALPYVRPADLQPVESQYLDRVTTAMATLNDDLNREQQTTAPPSALTQMRRDFEAVTASLATATPARLTAYRDSRLRRFLENFDLILTAEESAAQGNGAQRIHSSAYEQHREYYFQEPRVTRLIGYLYLQVPGRTFSDDELSTVNWAVF